MKKVIFLFVAVMVLFSCSKDDDGNEVFPSMSALVDNEEWSAVTRITVLEDGKFIITGTSLLGKILSVTIFGTTEGKYELSLTSATAGAVYKESASMTTEDAYVSATGEVDLTEVNTSKQKISGTFSFIVIRNLTNTINITEGEFKDLSYTVTGD
jgi:hypothetical protein